MSTPFYKDPTTIATGVIIAIALVSVSVFYANKNDAQKTLPELSSSTVGTVVPMPTFERPPAEASQATVHPAPADVKPQPEAVQENQAAPVIREPLPTLADSDDVFVSAAVDMTPSFSVWLTPKQQIRRWVSLVNIVAEEGVLISDLPLDYPMPKFKADEQGEQLFFNVNNQKRAQSLIDAVTAIPPSVLIGFYHHWQPLFEQAYAEFGNDDTFDQVLHRAIDNILAIPALPQPQELKQPAVFYVYADAQLEQANKLTKFMWRLGLENNQRIHSYLTQIKSAL